LGPGGGTVRGLRMPIIVRTESKSFIEWRRF
jgi:hypothetical protein